MYSNSVQTTPYKHSTNNNPATNSSNYNTSNTTSFNTMYSYPQQYHHHQHQQQQQLQHQSNPSSQYSNYYATTDLIQWHNRKYLSGSHNPGSGGPVDL